MRRNRLGKAKAVLKASAAKVALAPMVKDTARSRAKPITRLTMVRLE